MQSSHALPWGGQISGGAAVNSGNHPVTRQLMPPPSSYQFDESVEKDNSANASKSKDDKDEQIAVGRSPAGYHSAEIWDNLERVASENAVVMFSISSCCVCHVVKRLFSSLGVAPAVYEIDQEPAGPEIDVALQKLAGSSQALPAIFIGKKFLGGLDELITAHIGGALVPQLKQAGALWL